MASKVLIGIVLLAVISQVIAEDVIPSLTEVIDELNFVLLRLLKASINHVIGPKGCVTRMLNVIGLGMITPEVGKFLITSSDAMFGTIAGLIRAVIADEEVPDIPSAVGDLSKSVAKLLKASISQMIGEEGMLTRVLAVMRLDSITPEINKYLLNGIDTLYDMFEQVTSAVVTAAGNLAGGSG